MKPHRGVLILVLGILGLIMCGIFTGIPAWIMGKKDLKAIAAGEMDPAGQGLTKVGYILGIISVALTAIMVVVGVVAAVAGAAGAMAK
jgi:hypothetical protein